MCLELREWEATSAHVSFHSPVPSPPPPPAPTWTLQSSPSSTVSLARALTPLFISALVSLLLCNFPEISLQHITSAEIKLNLTEETQMTPPLFEEEKAESCKRKYVLTTSSHLLFKAGPTLQHGKFQKTKSSTSSIATLKLSRVPSLTKLC